MRYTVITLFPELIESAVTAGLLGKALDSGALAVDTINPRAFTHDRHNTVDDTPYGGGSGMVLMPGPIVEALESVPPGADGQPARRILMTPQGRPLKQKDCHRLAQYSALSVVCGRYEGFDDRIRKYVDEEISLGDFVLLGGEVAALSMLEAVGRLLPGVIGNRASTEEESHETGLLEYPQYTRPAEFRGEGVPKVLVSGNHAHIAKFRREQALRRTFERRPDLLAQAELSETEQRLVAQWQAECSGEGADA